MTPQDGDREARELATKLVCGLIDGPDGFNDPDSKHPDLRGYRRSWIRHFTEAIAAHCAAATAKERQARESKDLELQYRVLSYLGNGGLFNPQHMEHDKVRDLIMDLSDNLSVSRNQAVEANRTALEPAPAGGKPAP